MEYKYYVHDDDGKIKDAEFNTFPEAFDYAQNGLYTFIDKVSVNNEDDYETVWTWDDTRDREQAISDIASLDDEYDEPVYEEVEVEVKADNPEEFADFARLILGDNHSFFDTDFDTEVPNVKAPNIEVVDTNFDNDFVKDNNVDESLNEYWEDNGYKQHVWVLLREDQDVDTAIELLGEPFGEGDSSNPNYEYQLDYYFNSYEEARRFADKIPVEYDWDNEELDESLNESDIVDEEPVEDAVVIKDAEFEDENAVEEVPQEPVETDCVIEAATAVMAAYQNANKWLDSVKEVIYTKMNCPFFSSFVHTLAHTMPGRFDKFGDILHTVNMEIPYPATTEIAQKPTTIVDSFVVIFNVLDAIKEALNNFIKCTDEKYHGMACAAETLLNDIEGEYPMLYRLQAKAQECIDDTVSFDKFVGQYVEHKGDLLESLNEAHQVDKNSSRVEKVMWITANCRELFKKAFAKETGSEFNKLKKDTYDKIKKKFECNTKEASDLLVSAATLYSKTLNEHLNEDTHAKYAKPEGDRVKAYNNALKYAKRDNVPYIYGYVSSTENGKFFALDQPIKCVNNDMIAAEKKFRTQYKGASTIYTAYPNKPFVDESLTEDVLTEVGFKNFFKNTAQDIAGWFKGGQINKIVTQWAVKRINKDNKLVDTKMVRQYADAEKLAVAWSKQSIGGRAQIFATDIDQEYNTELKKLGKAIDKNNKDTWFLISVFTDGKAAPASNKFKDFVNLLNGISRTLKINKKKGTSTEDAEDEIDPIEEPPKKQEESEGETKKNAEDSAESIEVEEDEKSVEHTEVEQDTASEKSSEQTEKQDVDTNSNVETVPKELESETQKNIENSAENTEVETDKTSEEESQKTVEQPQHQTTQEQRPRADQFTLIDDEKKRIKKSSDLKGLRKLKTVINANDDAKIIDKSGEEVAD